MNRHPASVGDGRTRVVSSRRTMSAQWVKMLIACVLASCLAGGISRRAEDPSITKPVVGTRQGGILQEPINQARLDKTTLPEWYDRLYDCLGE